MKLAYDNILHTLRRTSQKIYIGIHRKTSIPQEPKSPYYSECIKIFSKLLECKETILLIAPISSKRHMKNEKYGIYISIHGRSIEVTNHVYNYIIQIDEKTWNLMVKDFDLELEERTSKFEKDINKNIKHSLKTILNSIEDKENDEKRNEKK